MKFCNLFYFFLIIFSLLFSLFIFKIQGLESRSERPERPKDSPRRSLALKRWKRLKLIFSFLKKKKVAEKD